MSKKEILFGDEARDKLMSGIELIAKAVGSTMGAQGNTVLIESKMHTAGLTATKDGVTVAKSIVDLKDPTEEMAVRLMRQAATKTADLAGDGTTTAIVLANAIIQQAQVYIKDKEVNMTEVCRYIKSFSKIIIDGLDDASTPITDENIHHVATVSANNDSELGKIISDAYKAVGNDGIVKVHNSKNHETFSKETDGITFDRGLLSPYLMTDRRKKVSDNSDCLVLVTDLKIASVMQIAILLDHSVKSNKPLIIIGELEMEAMSTFNHNVNKGLIKGCYITPPSFGDRRSSLMSDIAVAIGATYISERTGSSWEDIDIEYLGSADRVVVDMESTSIISDEKNSDKVVKLVSDLKEMLAEETDAQEKGSLHERISSLCGKVSTIYVGGDTDIEQKEKRDRVDDAVLATRAAIDEGILAGGGIALLDQSDFDIEDESDSCVIASDILSKAMWSPFDTIVSNAGMSPSDVCENGEIGNGCGYDVRAEVYGDMIDMGIIDPAKVTKIALKNAVSVATTIITTSAIITNVQ
jgi:chaperonin GroEL